MKKRIIIALSLAALYCVTSSSLIAMGFRTAQHIKYEVMQLQDELSQAIEGSLSPRLQKEILKALNEFENIIKSDDYQKLYDAPDRNEKIRFWRNLVDQVKQEWHYGPVQ